MDAFLSTTIFRKTSALLKNFNEQYLYFLAFFLCPSKALQTIDKNIKVKDLYITYHRMVCFTSKFKQN